MMTVSEISSGQWLLVTQDGGIYRDVDGAPIMDSDCNALEWYAQMVGIVGYRIVSADLPWKVVEDAN